MLASVFSDGNMYLNEAKQTNLNKGTHHANYSNHHPNSFHPCGNQL